jgi:lipoyl(octanoyl) transferase
MPMSQRKPAPRPFAAQFHLLGQVDYEDCLTAQKRVAYDALTRGDGRLVAILCEHPPLITIGRRGSREQLRFTGAELAERELTVRYVARGGGCLLQGPGQLGIYVITQLAWHGWSVGDFLRRLQSGLQRVIEQAGLSTQSLPGRFGLWGTSGLLAAVGASVKYGVTSQGAFLNVENELTSAPRVEVMAAAEYADLIAGGDSDRQAWPRRPIQSSLRAEASLCGRSSAGKMPEVQAAVVTHLAAAFECLQPQIITGHPLLPELSGSLRRDSAA